METMKIVLLGTGSSHGVPIPGCTCLVCVSENSKDKRLRSSAFIEYKNQKILIDAGPDVRQQLLVNKITHIDAVLITHEHNDHIIGLDDLRPFNYWQKKPVDIYANQGTIDAICHRFDYIFGENPYSGALKANLHKISYDQSFKLGDVEIVPVLVHHGDSQVLGFRIDRFAYITDAKRISDRELAKLKGIEVLVINALHFSGHYAHFNVAEAIEVSKTIRARRIFFTHISHFMGLNDEVNNKLPEHIDLGYDGQVIEL